METEQDPFVKQKLQQMEEIMQLYGNDKKWNSNQKQRFRAQYNQLASYLEAKGVKSNYIQYMQSKGIRVTKRITFPLVALLYETTHIKRSREERRVEGVAVRWIDANWTTFEPYLRTVEVEDIEGELLTIHFMGKLYHVNKNGKMIEDVKSLDRKKLPDPRKEYKKVMRKKEHQINEIKHDALNEHDNNPDKNNDTAVAACQKTDISVNITGIQKDHSSLDWLDKVCEGMNFANELWDQIHYGYDV